MTKALDIITGALQKLGIYSPVETISAQDQALGQTVLTDMIDEWFGEYFYPQQRTITTFPIAIDQSAYTIGPNGADITAFRPEKIFPGPGAATFTPTIGTASLVKVISAVEWNAFHASSSGVTDQQGTPDTLFYDPQYPTGILLVGPTPIATGMMTFIALSAFGGFADINTTDYLFDNGTQEALKNNLAVALKPYFSQSVINPATIEAATQSRAWLKRRNTMSRALIGREPRTMPTAAPNA